MIDPKQQTLMPSPGMLATVRNRRAIVSAVDTYDSAAGRFHLVNLEYIDADGVPSDTLLWEREPGATLLEPNALPQVSARPAMSAVDFDALQRATRWTALSPFLGPDGLASSHWMPITSPLFGAVQVEDFQLVPLLKAMQMPRISLLLSDDVGLGKTIETGLILTELLQRRRIRRVLVMCTAALRTQWQQEMKDKFSLGFEIIDRAETHYLQKQFGLDANPWRTYPRIITSYYYLRQPDVLQQFIAACRQPAGSAQLPWDLLVVDEAHNLSPAAFGDDSDLAQMLREITPWFEHKLFLTATPHSGHTRQFTGLLELLDPIRFTQTSDLTDASKRRIREVVVRRLKREINALDKAAGKVERFSERIPEPLALYFGQREHLLARALEQFRLSVRQLIASRQRSEQIAGAFAVEILNKRHLSCPYTFADSWHRFKDGIAEEDIADTAELNAARRAVKEDLDDDSEVEGRIGHAAHTVGAWLKPLVDELQTQITGVDKTLELLGLGTHDELAEAIPEEDARWDRFVQLISDRLRAGKTWRTDERLIVFTEYKTTLDYLARRLQALYQEPGVIRELYGGMDQEERDQIKAAFNNPADPVRILVATDAASEGLNLQETARFVLHWDIPFNPARLDQRNGRLDRHGQARDVYVFHFASEADADLRFLAHVVGKVHTIREELGSMGEVFDAAFERRFILDQDSDNILADLDREIQRRKGRADVPRDDSVTTGGAEKAALDWLTAEIDLSAATLKDTLERALGFGIGLPRFEPTDARGRVRLQMPVPPRWESLVDDSLRLPAGKGQLGPLPHLVFDSTHFIETRNGRPIFRASHDTTLLHLGHPLFTKALNMYARARFPGEGSEVSRWTVRYGPVPAGADALLLLTVEEVAVNELRETFHHWVRTVRLPVSDGRIGEPLPHVPAAKDERSADPPGSDDVELARLVWEEVDLEVKAYLKQLATDLTTVVTDKLRDSGRDALAETRQLFQQRLGEVKRAMSETTLTRIERELANLEAEQAELMQQAALFDELESERALRRRIASQRQAELEEELRRRQAHYQELLDRLQAEQERVVKELLPRRYQLRGKAQVFPVTVEIRIPEAIR